MLVEKTKTNRYEASCVVNNGVGLLDGSVMFIEYTAFGDTHFEAIRKCLQKVDMFLNPGDYETCNDCGKVACMCYEQAVGV